MKSKIIRITNFHATKLNNERDILIYLPEGYEESPEERYPVLYMHDGKNVFHNTKQAYSESSWNVNLTVDSLIEQGIITKLIIVGISNNSSRASEYTHRSSVHRIVKHSVFGEYELNAEGNGLLYEDFIIHDLKPYIDSQYRTLMGPEDTGMIGSSMGGLVTYNIGFRRPDVFGMIGVMSPAFFWDDEEALVPYQKEPLKIWMDVGEGETDYIPRTKKIADVLCNAGYRLGEDFMFYQEPMAVHNEKSWGERLPMILIYFFGTLGKPVRTQLYGLTELGLNSKNISINPLIFYDSGVVISHIRGVYTVTDKGIVSVSAEGNVIPKGVGETEVTFEYDGMKHTRKYTVIDIVPEFVTISYIVEVPMNTPEDADVYIASHESMPLKLDKREKGIYQGSATYRWGQLVTIQIRREEQCFGKENLTVEQDKNGIDITLKQFIANKNKEEVYWVEKWRDIDNE